MRTTISQLIRTRRRPRYGRASLMFLLLPCMLLGCATTGINHGQLNLVSTDEEWRMGQRLEVELAKKLHLVNDPSALAYVTRIGQRIVAQTELGNRPWEFHIVADPEINAFSIPGGHVYVNTGLIAAARNTSELAGVMSHEISHGVARHATERMSTAYGINALGGLLLGNHPSMTKQIAAQVAAGGFLARYSRGAESEADRIGVQYMYRAGYNPNGMATMFEKLLSERKRRPSSVEQFFASHPLAEDRIVAVRRQIATLPPKSGLIATDRSLPSIQQRVRRYSG